MEELQKIIDWIDSYDKEYEIFPHPNLIKMKIKLRIEELKISNNSEENLNKINNHG